MPIRLWVRLHGRAAVAAARRRPAAVAARRRSEGGGVAATDSRGATVLQLPRVGLDRGYSSSFWISKAGAIGEVVNGRRESRESRESLCTRRTGAKIQSLLETVGCP